MRLDWLRAFRAVMQTGTTTGAAAILLRTQPQISRMIASLENTLELQLFVREGRRLVPTDEALQFFRHIEPLLIGLQEVQSAAADLKQKRGRPLVIGAEPFLLHVLVPEAVAELEHERSVRCSVDICIRGLGLWMAHGNADLGVVALPFGQTDMRPVVFAEAEIVAVLPPGHRLADHSSVEMLDISDERFIALRPSTLMRAQIDIAAARVGAVIRPDIEVASGVTSCDFVARNLGITLADPIVAMSFLPRVVVKPFTAGLKLSYGFLLPTGQPVTEDVSRLMQTIIRCAVALGRPFVHATPPARLGLDPGLASR